jgi:hypothetical protein
MREQFLPIDDNGIAQIGVTRRQQFEGDAAAGSRTRRPVGPAVLLRPRGHPRS